MGKKILSPFILILISQIGLVTSGLADDSHVGDIRYSILSEDQFRTLHGTEWELLQGQPVPGDSELIEYWGNRNLPDARGVFLRSRNHNRDRNQGCTAGDLECGAYQADQIKNHGHTVSFYRIDSNSDGPHRSRWGTSLNGHAFSCPGAVDNHWTADPTGGSETRPRNIIVNTFIKVRENAPARPQTQISAEWVARLFSSPEFLRALTQAVTSAFRSMI